MKKYGTAAEQAARLLGRSPSLSPREAWERATIAVFGEGTSLQVKGCPRGAFLGLCSAGLVRGVAPGRYSSSVKNAQYAVDAVDVLRRRPELVNDPDRLWTLIPKDDPNKVSNSQMDVVCALWSGGLIVRPAIQAT